MKKGDRVKVIQILNDEIAADLSTNDSGYIGECGIITYIGTGKSVGEMTYVKLDNGWQDAFWNEELELI